MRFPELIRPFCQPSVIFVFLMHSYQKQCEVISPGGFDSYFPDD